MEREACVRDHGLERSDLCAGTVAEVGSVEVGTSVRRNWTTVLMPYTTDC